MNHYQAAGILRECRYLGQSTQRHHVVSIGQKGLETDDSLCHGIGYLRKRVSRGAGNIRMKSEITIDAFGLCLLQPLIDRVNKVLTRTLHSEIHDGCHSAADRGHGAAEEIIGRSGPPHGNSKMHVRVDHPRENMQACCVNDLFGP